VTSLNVVKNVAVGLLASKNVLPRDQRLNLAKEFRHLKKEARSLQSRYFTLLYRPSREMGSSKAGFVVSNRIGKAAQRNKLRRLFREVVQNNWAKLPKSVELVLIARNYPSQVSYEDINIEFNKLLPKISV
jgi:ribonuclease P protein component